MAWTKKLLRGLQMHEGLEPLLRHVGGGFTLFFFLKKRGCSKNEKHEEGIFYGDLYILLTLNIYLRGWF